MCGVVGVFLFDENLNAYQYILNGITVLQHRGQDSAGIFTCKSNEIYKHKNIGKVNAGFNEDYSKFLIGNYGIGHIRYATTGSLSIKQSQPLYLNGKKQSVSMVHNGNLTNTDNLTDILKENNITIKTTSDTEILLHYFVHLLDKKLDNKIELKEAIFNVIENIMASCKGSYSVIVMITGYGLVAFRDPYGIRPLCFGKQNRFDYAIMSESIGIKSIGFNLVSDVKPGECILVTKNEIHIKICGPNYLKPCLFEFVYFARPESVIDNILVYKARQNMGEALAKNIQTNYAHLLSQIDVVMPVPDSARISALKVAHILKKPYCEGLIKNAYIGRTFIMPNQEERTSKLRLKLNAIDYEFRNKSVLLIDDSIVRGNTSIQIIKLARAAGATQIIFASIAAPIIYPNFYGISIPTSNELVAYNKTNDEIQTIIGADCLIYNSLNDVIESCRKVNNKIGEFETSCFDGKYIK